MARADELADLVDGAFEVEALEPGRLIVRRDATIGGATVTATKTLELGGDRRSPTLR